MRSLEIRSKKYVNCSIWLQQENSASMHGRNAAAKTSIEMHWGSAAAQQHLVCTILVLRDAYNSTQMPKGGRAQCSCNYDII